MKTIFAAVLVCTMTLVGCQSSPKAPETAVASPPAASVPDPAPQPAAVADASSITVEASGFSPLAPAPANTLALGLHFARPSEVRSWTVELVAADGTPVPGFRGEAPGLPSTLNWAGVSSEGNEAPEGTYVARLTVEYGNTDTSVSQSEPFVVDRTPPSGTIEVSAGTDQPSGTVLADPQQIVFKLLLVQGAAPIANWRLGVIHPDGRRFRDFINEDYRQNTVVWNGKALNNAALEPGVAYDVVAQVFDRYGNVGLVKTALTVTRPVPVVVPEPAPPVEQPTAVTVSVDGQVVSETQLYFPAFSARWDELSSDKKALNSASLERLAEALKAAPGTKIRVVGHANQVFWNDEKKGLREQRETLLPLSLARAETVRDALVRAGLDRGLFEVSGVGASGNVVPFGDLSNNWKNRRVEFLVE